MTTIFMMRSPRSGATRIGHGPPERRDSALVCDRGRYIGARCHSSPVCPVLCGMTFYLPNSSVQPTGFEPAEFLDVPPMADAPDRPVPTEDAPADPAGDTRESP
jgi:hypothetical protein